MNRQFVTMLFHAACIFCLLAAFSQACFLLYSRDDTRGLASPAAMITTTKTPANSADGFDPNEGVKLFDLIRIYATNSSDGVLFQPENTNGRHTWLYVAGDPISMESLKFKAGRFFGFDEMNRDHKVLVTFADSWIDLYFYQENQKMFVAGDEYEIVGVLEQDAALQRNGYDAIAPLCTTQTLIGKWIISSTDMDLSDRLVDALRNLGLSVVMSPVQADGFNQASAKVLLSDKFFLIISLGLIVSLATLSFNYIQHLNSEKKWNHIRYRVGARKRTHYCIAIRRQFFPSVMGALLGSLLQLLFWIIVFNSSRAMMRIVLFYPIIIVGTIIIWMALFTLLYFRSDFISKSEADS